MERMVKILLKKNVPKEKTINNDEWRNDWRIIGQEGYLKNKHLHHRGFKRALCVEDYLQCEFCWSHFEEDVMAYFDPNGKVWICEECYQDFKSYFNWTVEEVEN